MISEDFRFSTMVATTMPTSPPQAARYLLTLASKTLGGRAQLAPTQEEFYILGRGNKVFRNKP